MARTATLIPGFERERTRWDGEVLPAVYAGERTCGRCGFGVLVVESPATQDALFFHGGYGASERVTVATCLACGRASELALETVRPPR